MDHEKANQSKPASENLLERLRARQSMTESEKLDELHALEQEALQVYGPEGLAKLEQAYKSEIDPMDFKPLVVFDGNFSNSFHHLPTPP